MAAVARPRLYGLAGKFGRANTGSAGDLDAAIARAIRRAGRVGAWPVGCQCHFPSERNADAANRISRTKHAIPHACAGIRLSYVNSYTVGSGPPPEASPGNNVVIQTAIEDSAGNVYPVWYAGQRSFTLQPRQLITSDPVGLQVAAAGYIWIRHLVTVGGGEYYPTHHVTISAIGEGYYDGSDRVDSGVISTGTARVMTPCAILATPTAGASVGVCCLGDSITHGDNDISEGSGTDDGGGWPKRAFDGVLPYCGMGQTGDKASGFVLPLASRNRHEVSALYSDVIIALGANDIGDGAAGLEANMAAIGAYFDGIGVRPWLATITPRTTSTDFWATLGGQTVTEPQTAQIALYNAWARGTPTPSPFAGCIDFAAAVESGSTGKWASAGVVETGTATGGSTSTVDVAGETWATNAYHRQVIHILTGAAAGDYRRIASNTGTRITIATTPAPDAAFTAAVQSGDTFEVIGTYVYDGLHPNRRGYTAMAAGIDTDVFVVA